MLTGKIVRLKQGNVAIVKLDDDRELEIAINKSVIRKKGLSKISICDRFAIEIVEPPKLSRAYALIKTVSRDDNSPNC